ncbi:hypothetical protein SCLCIDRAFT_1210261 [Scleroderma citrinum Foug A]|uniref:Uncharacterized protein n=1 Tax=Scleroderma citrinum Foug A TaxID=1036808 RepID=A0A0C3EI84_9AGAM|nr:hypothetical protein SCLCIDRAFT_1210261 [Scleroderma citrinum Foug A]
MPLPGLNAAVNWVSGWSIRISSSEEQAPGRNRIPKGHPPLIKGSLGAQTPWRFLELSGHPFPVVGVTSC